MKPGDFYVGVVDFFAVALPGAIGCAWIVRAEPAVIDAYLPKLDGAAAWAAFAVASYALGLLVYFVSSFLDVAYKPQLLKKLGWKDEAYAAAPPLARRT